MNNVRLSRMEQKLDALTGRLMAGEPRTTRLERGLSQMSVAMAGGFRSINAKLGLLTKLDAKLGFLASRAVRLDEKLDLLARRVVKVEAKLDSIMEAQGRARRARAEVGGFSSRYQ